MVAGYDPNPFISLSAGLSAFLPDKLFENLFQGNDVGYWGHTTILFRY